MTDRQILQRWNLNITCLVIDKPFRPQPKHPANQNGDCGQLNDDDHVLAD